MNTPQAHIQLYLQNINDCPKDADNYLTEQDKIRLSKIISTKTQKEFTNSHYLLNSTLEKLLHIPAISLKFSYNNDGKPFIDKEIKKITGKALFFSLSHSKEYAILAISESTDLGVDIEETSNRSLNSCLKLSERFFHHHEQTYLHEENDDDEKKKRFYQIWTLKEAYLKAIGTGIKTQLNTLNFSLSNDKISLSVEGKTIKSLNFFSYNIQNYTVSLAAHTSNRLEVNYPDSIN